MSKTVCCALLLAAMLLVSPVAAARQPNIVLVMSDDMGYGDLGCHGNTMIRTPHLDRLHDESVRLTNFHVDPTCSPTRAALMTGRYSTRTGVWHTIMGRSLMYADEVTLAEVLSQAGYRTGIFGKWHLGDNYPLRPQDRGFDEVLVHGGGGVGQTPDYWGNDYFDDTYFHNGRAEKQSGYCTNVFFDAAMAFIERHRERPFFVYLPTNVAHSPNNVDDAYSKPYRDRGVAGPMANFYGMIENLDENVGRLRQRLTDLELADNTILIFMTDNGTAGGAANRGAARRGEAKNNAWPGFSAGMRGQKGSQYDGGHRVPCFIRYPAGKLTSQRDVPQLTAHIDLFPTLLELCQAKPPADRQLDGRSLVPLLTNNHADWPERTLFVHSQRIEYPEKWRQSAVMTQRWRLIDGKQLFDMASDAGQQRDVAAENSAVVQQLRKAYDTWWQSLTPAFDRYAYLVVGSDRENPAHINCMDWHADIRDIPWNQPMIRQAPWANGYWMIEVAQPGDYEITLRQQPAQANKPLEATKARVKIGDVEQTQDVAPNASAATLRLKLPAGPQRMQTWLTAADGQSRGAFFVEVRRLR
jgi:arylsulfatase A-like enzyme